MITRYKAADPLDPTSQAEYKVLAAGAQRYWHGTRAAFEQVKNSIPNNTMICITDDNDAPSDNAPIGSVFDYEGNTAPDGYLFCDGSTFDTSLYPDLYLFLGSDTLPVRGSQYDWANPSYYTYNELYSGITTPSDGLFCVTGRPNVNGGWVSVNDVNVSYSYYSNGFAINAQVQIPVTKGDIVKSTGQLQSDFTSLFVPVTKYKLIKATSNMSKSDASALLAQVIQHMTPDYAHQKTISSNTWTADEDVWVSYTNSYSSGASPYPLYADGVEISTRTTNSRTHSFAGRISKGTVLSATGLNSENFRAWPFK